MEKLQRVIIIESKSISEYLQQLDDFGEDVSEYESLWGYSIGETEPRIAFYDYPDYGFELTDRYTNLGSPLNELVSSLH
jgi:lysine 2,3-aminomutase